MRIVFPKNMVKAALRDLLRLYRSKTPPRFGSKERLDAYIRKGNISDAFASVGFLYQEESGIVQLTQFDGFVEDRPKFNEWSVQIT